MGKISDILRSGEGSRLSFMCPGCNMHHTIKYGANGWGWNGNVDKPTFTPSILVSGVDFTAAGKADLDQWSKDGCPSKPVGYKFDSVNTVCHSFVTDGRIHFLMDCTHALKGQTIDIPKLKDSSDEDN